MAFYRNDIVSYFDADKRKVFYGIVQSGNKKSHINQMESQTPSVAMENGVNVRLSHENITNEDECSSISSAPEIAQKESVRSLYFWIYVFFLYGKLNSPVFIGIMFAFQWTSRFACRRNNALNCGSNNLVFH